MGRQNKGQKIKIFRVTISDEHTHKQLFIAKFSRAKMFVVLTTIVVVTFALFFSLIAFTPINTFIPGYPDAHTQRAAIQNAVKIDSLENVIYRWELYSENLRRVIDGREPIKIDSLIKSTATAITGLDPLNISKQDSVLRSHVQEAEQFQLSGDKKRKLPLEGIHFFVPLKGVVSQAYDKHSHPYVNISAKANSVVAATLDGTVVLTGWDSEEGYIIQIQHANDILSIYKHNHRLLKKKGDRVSAGTAIAILGTSTAEEGGEHLKFELWHEGETIDPTKYMSF